MKAFRVKEAEHFTCNTQSQAHGAVWLSVSYQIQMN